MQPTDINTWAVGLVLTGVVGTLSFLLRGTFLEVKSAVESIGEKIETLSARVETLHGDRRVSDTKLDNLATRHQELLVRVEKLERRLDQISEGIVG